MTFDQLVKKLASRKLAVTVFVAVVVAAGEHFGVDLDDTQVYGLVATAIAYVLGQGAIDYKGTKAVK